MVVLIIIAVSGRIAIAINNGTRHRNNAGAMIQRTWHLAWYNRVHPTLFTFLMPFRNCYCNAFFYCETVSRVPFLSSRGPIAFPITVAGTIELV